MFDNFCNAIIFAQNGGQPPAGGIYQLMFMGLMIMAMFYFMLIRPKQKMEHDRRNMLAALKKNDHVVTVGGIKGVVAHVKPDEQEVILRIDEATGTKVRVELRSIASVVAASEPSAGDTKK